MTPISLFWHRRDLRITDNRGLAAALDTGLPVLGFFCFDKTILDVLPKVDARNRGSSTPRLEGIATAYRSAGNQLIARHGVPLEEIQSLRQALHAAGHDLHQIHTNRDYAPYPVARDGDVRAWCEQEGISFHAHDDHVILPPEAVLKDDGAPTRCSRRTAGNGTRSSRRRTADPLAEAVVALDSRGASRPSRTRRLPPFLRWGLTQPRPTPPDGRPLMRVSPMRRAPPLRRAPGHALRHGNRQDEPSPAVRHRLGAVPSPIGLCPQ